MRFTLAIASVLGLLTTGGPVPASAAPDPTTPRVNLVVPRVPQQLTIVGKNFGAPPAGVPCVSCTPTQLVINNGQKPFSVPLWSDGKIVATDILQLPGTQNVLFVANASGLFAPAAYSMPGGTPHPTITGVTFSGKGVKRGITVTGSGFGAAPAGVPGNTNIGNFSFVLVDSKQTSCCMILPAGASGPIGTRGAWNAGYYGDGVTLNYVSWTDTQIVISGFGDRYGSNDWVANPGDRFYILVTSTTNTGNNTTFYAGVVK